MEPGKVLSLTLELESNPIKRIPVVLSAVGESDKLAFCLKNVLTRHECESLIQISEKEGYSVVPVSVSGRNEEINSDLRSGFRLIVDDEDFTDKLWARIHTFLPQSFYGHRILGLNERLRYLRYGPGDKFKPHEDANYSRSDGSAISLLTLQIYLNEGFGGGATTFLTYGDERARVSVDPKVGMILVFQQDILHEGSIVTHGTKYTIRTDVMYTHLSK